MFTGIIETLGEVKNIQKNNSNIDFTFKSDFTQELKIDQSVAHNGVCLTVVSIEDDNYTVTAIQETLDKTNLGNLKTGDLINLERGMRMNAHLDGHIVQGHVDQTAVCEKIEDQDGSWKFTFRYSPEQKNVTIEKGSITINGVSLTVVDSELDAFSVAIIPFTYEHTTFKYIKVGDTVNLEFDVIGKYVKRLMQLS
ncbi:riboflavin synthase [Psychroflexus halocasei]|uniref:Riboflavin synthase n=1 Tax=Psychroflexus halocasei TaxID=908615 RepID=A0A1H4CLU6_9FLAO|nr:riboflavin synthase [Psychroflexus halocasei]SEA61314.1 riboflavin synthase [Psychroflexus halocasei]